MNFIDTAHYALMSIERAPVRTALTLLAMAIGVAAVVLLTGLGDGARRYVVDEFASLGTNLVIVLPGKSETTGGMLSASMGGATRDLTIDDAAALVADHRVSRVVPIVVGAAGVAYAGLEREVPIFGGTHELLAIRHWKIRKGRFLPDNDWHRAAYVCVIGQTIEQELFDDVDALGQWLRVGDRRFRVIGVLSSQGRSMGIDTQELVVIPVASAMALFNTESMFRILVEATERPVLSSVTEFVRTTLTARHHGEEDITVITQDAVLQTFDQLFQVLTLTVAGIAAISLCVAGILVMNVMLVSVTQRRTEIGLLKALGATPTQIVQIFLVEAVFLSSIGASVGLAFGLGLSWGIGQFLPSFSVTPPVWAAAAALGVALLTGLVFGLQPARRASRLDPIAALARN